MVASRGASSHSSSHRGLRRAGFTLLEMMVSSVIMAIIIVAVGAAFVAVQASYQAEAQIKTTVEGGRIALAYVERSVHMAGYGLDPRHAFSMESPGPVKDNLTVSIDGGSGVGASFTSDDLAFRFRDPTFLRRGQLSGADLAVKGPDGAASMALGIKLRSGQPIVIACPTKDAYVVKRTASAVAATVTTLTALTDYGAPFTTSADPCLSEVGPTAPYVMLVRELRFRVISVGGRPYLVAYNDLAADVTNANTTYDPIAADVEDFQVAYVMNRPYELSLCCSDAGAVDVSGNRDWILGDATSEAIPSLDGGSTSPTFATPYDSPLRFNDSPANIRMVRISMTLRSSRSESTSRKGFPPRSLENHAIADAGTDGYYRTVMTTTVRVPNMLSRQFFTPPVARATGGDPNLNAWGG